MSEKKFRVLECENCETLTYKRTSHKTVKCPLCGTTLTGDPIELFDTAKEATAYIKQTKLDQGSEAEKWYETFE